MFKKEVDVIFFIEHKDRELESVQLICKQLNKEGKSTLILSVYFHVYCLYLYKAKVFVFPYLINKDDWPVNIVYQMYGDKVKYLNMNWEQLISKVNEEYKKPQDSFVKNRVNHIAWNENFKRYLIRYGVNENNIRVTGNPANEVLYNLLQYSRKWREKLSVEFGLDINKKWLFMPMNYGWAFSSDDLIKAKIKKGYPEKIAWEYREYSQKCLKKFIYFIERVSKEYSYEIVIRPHPSITKENYESIFIEEIGYVPKNIVINKEYSIREWIVSSDIVGSSWSTSVWDAYNIGKPVFLFTPYKRPKWLDVWWNREVVNFKEYYNEDELSIKDTKLEPIESIKNISDFICELIKNSNYDIKTQRHLFSIKNNIKILRSFLLNRHILDHNNLKYDYFNSICSLDKEN